ncbi:ribosomal protein S18-alanine N-acetyltransferase [Gammaproteobacteria bacterium]|nr:ribosomal protein S18-alanine N-acetyltransferase [Gammaproteobacteria bacterium]
MAIEENKFKDQLDYRYMTESDLEAVLEIERLSNPFPWTEQNFIDCLRRDYYCLIQTYSDGVSGFAIQSIALDEAHLLNIGVSSNKRRQGLGSDLLEKIIYASETMGSNKIFLEVRVSNEAATNLYLDFGFKQIGVRKDYYRLPEGKEDALLMSKSLRKNWKDRFFSN